MSAQEVESHLKRHPQSQVNEAILGLTRYTKARFLGRLKKHCKPKVGVIHYNDHAPKGGITIQGKAFVGGEFIPAEVMAQASPKERAAIQGQASGQQPAQQAAPQVAQQPQQAPQPQPAQQPAPAAAVPAAGPPVESENQKLAQAKGLLEGLKQGSEGERNFPDEAELLSPSLSRDEAEGRLIDWAKKERDAGKITDEHRAFIHRMLDEIATAHEKRNAAESDDEEPYEEPFDETIDESYINEIADNFMPEGILTLNRVRNDEDGNPRNDPGTLKVEEAEYDDPEADDTSFVYRWAIFDSRGELEDTGHWQRDEETAIEAGTIALEGQEEHEIEEDEDQEEMDEDEQQASYRNRHARLVLYRQRLKRYHKAIEGVIHYADSPGNCGDGAGGFRQGNTCGKGGRGPFAHKAHEAASRSQTGWFGDQKVFISHAWNEAKKDPEIAALGFEGFKRGLLQAHLNKELDLGRGDLVEAMDPQDERESRLTHSPFGLTDVFGEAIGPRYHFIRTDQPRGAVQPQSQPKPQAQAPAKPVAKQPAQKARNVNQILDLFQTSNRKEFIANIEKILTPKEIMTFGTVMGQKAKTPAEMVALLKKDMGVEGTSHHESDSHLVHYEEHECGDGGNVGGFHQGNTCAALRDHKKERRNKLQRERRSNKSAERKKAEKAAVKAEKQIPAPGVEDPGLNAALKRRADANDPSLKPRIRRKLLALDKSIKLKRAAEAARREDVTARAAERQKKLVGLLNKHLGSRENIERLKQYLGGGAMQSYRKPEHIKTGEEETEADKEKTETPEADEPIKKNCGDGGGGFKKGNVCASGKRRKPIDAKVREENQVNKTGPLLKRLKAIMAKKKAQKTDANS